MCAIALVAGLLIRLGALPLPGAGDVDPWKVWSYHFVTDGVTKLYGTGSPPAYVDFAFHDKIAPVNYPPLALYELGAAGLGVLARNRRTVSRHRRADRRR